MRAWPGFSAPSGRWAFPAQPVAAAAAGAAVLAWLAPLSADLGVSVMVGRMVVCVAFLVAAAIAARRRPDLATGALMYAFALLYAADAATAETLVPWRWTVGILAADLWLPVLAALVLGFPSGRVSGFAPRAVVAFACLVMLVAKPIVLMWGGPGAICATCAPAGNVLFTGPAPFDFAKFLEYYSGAVHGVIGVVLALLLVRFARASRPARAAMASLLIPVALLATKLLLDELYLRERLLYAADEFALITTPNTILFAAVPLGYVAAVSRASGWPAAIERLIIEIEGSHGPKLNAAIARALRDPSLTIGYWAQQLGRYVSAEGAPLDLDACGAARAATVVQGEHGPLAVMLHDRALLAQPALLQSVSAAARLALENERLRAEVRAQLAEVVRSRARIVEATDAERRRIERDLHDGAQQRLVSLRIVLTMLKAARGPEADASELDELIEELDRHAVDAIGELRSLARGIHPSLLADEGLEAALEALAQRAPVPVLLGAMPGRRADPAVEIAAYYVCSEAIVNAAKHTEASVVRVDIENGGGALTVRIQDDGSGGARIEAGTGLRGLQDRVEAVGGSLSISSEPGCGTTLTANFPDGTMAKAR